ncbi:MMPL family transporter [Fodinicola feengrottensis]|uniref:MMPL family transporter n=1 Tax=Fodinicola feengrottensis TaxID=435914 RepID=UPI002442B47A|nr:MMPL family transporter [Fodinicola feengrottensis]
MYDPPALGLRLALPDNGTEEPGSPSRTTYDLVAKHFGEGFNGPLLVTVDIIASTDPIGVTNKIADEIRRVPGVAAVPLATPNPKADTAIIQVVPTTAPDSPQTEQLVTRLRALEPHFLAAYGTATAVTGLTAVGIDVSAKLGGSLLPFGLLVVGLSLVLLAMVFRSIAVPIKATLGYLLSVGAAFGATSFVFVQGHLAGILNVSHVGNVISFLPIILMGVLFGLAMDYEVFLVSRIREDYVHHRDPRHAIESGFVSASRVVVSAAIIMFAVFAAFVPEGSATIKPIAFSLAVGVFVDAFIVRMTLVPAVLALLGHRAWWLPTWLDRKLPIFDAEGDAMVHELRLADWPSPRSGEVISARELRVGDDRDRTVFGGVELHVAPGQLLGLHGPGPSGKSALLFTLAGRVSRVDGDLKVLGHVLPQHAHAVRTKVALISCRDTDAAADQARAAVAAGITLVLLDDLDTVVNTAQREIFRALFAQPSQVTFVFTCQNPLLLQDILPPDKLTTVALAAQPVEVA